MFPDGGIEIPSRLFRFSQSDMDKKQESDQPPAIFLDVKLFL